MIEKNRGSEREKWFPRVRMSWYKLVASKFVSLLLIIVLKNTFWFKKKTLAECTRHPAFLTFSTLTADYSKFLYNASKEKEWVSEWVSEWVRHSITCQMNNLFLLVIIKQSYIQLFIIFFENKRRHKKDWTDQSERLSERVSEWMREESANITYYSQLIISLSLSLKSFIFTQANLWKAFFVTVQKKFNVDNYFYFHRN